MFLFLLIKMLILKALEMMGQSSTVTEHGLVSPIPAQEVRENFPGGSVTKSVLFF